MGGCRAGGGRVGVRDAARSASGCMPAVVTATAANRVEDRRQTSCCALSRFRIHHGDGILVFARPPFVWWVVRFHANLVFLFLLFVFPLVTSTDAVDLAPVHGVVGIRRDRILTTVVGRARRVQSRHRSREGKVLCCCGISFPIHRHRGIGRPGLALRRVRSLQSLPGVRMVHRWERRRCTTIAGILLRRRRMHVVLCCWMTMHSQVPSMRWH